MKQWKQRLKMLAAAVLCLTVAVTPLPAFAETSTDGTDEYTSILSDDFEEIKREAEAVKPEHEKLITTYASARAGHSMNVTLNVGAVIGYNGYQTRDYSLSDGTTVFCMEPSQNSPSAGGYVAAESSDALLSAMMYYGYGGPGYESDLGMKRMLDPALYPYAYVLTHMAVSYIFDNCSDDTDAFMGTNQGTIDGLKNIVATISGYAWSVPGNFKAYVMSTGSGHQAMGFATYTPAGWAKLVKKSANPAMTDGNSCYSLAGAEYGLYSDYECTNQVGALVTDENGSSNAVEADEGSYWAKELKAPKGYALDKGKHPVKVVSGETTVLEVIDYPQSDPIGILLGKVDAETNANKPQGSASLGGAEFTVKYYAGLYDTDPAKRGRTAVRTWVLRTNEEGKCAMTDSFKVSGDDFFYNAMLLPTLPIGTITIQETKAPEGYLINPEVFVRKITSDGTIESVNTYNQPTILEQPIYGGVKIQKRDYETGGTSPIGGAALSGGEISIINANENPVFVEGRTYKKGETVKVLVTDEAGCAQTEADTLPHGDYIARETKAPEGYLLSGVTEQHFSIRENGVIVDLTGEDTSIKDRVKRGDFELRKIDSKTQDAMPDVEFELTSIVTGETHTFTTDENGYYSSASSWNPHTQNTNGGGSEDGMWFGQTADGAVAEADDSLGALPYGDYALDELESYANAGKDMFHGTLHINRDSVTVELGNIENEGDAPEITISTKAKDSTSGTQLAKAEDSAEITDEVFYKGCIPGREYTVRGVLMDKETKEPLLIDGKKVTAKTTFKAEKPEGSVKLAFTFNASGLAGKTVVVYEKLFYRTFEAAVHEDINDMAQSIYFPEIATHLKDTESGSHEAEVSEKLVLADEVFYRGLMPGETYTVKGVLMDKETEEPLLIDGKEVTAEAEFAPEKSEGSVELTFTFNASGLGGKVLVAFERVMLKGKVIAVHEDIEDEEQTVSIAEEPETFTPPQTGVQSHLMLYACAGLTAGAFALAAGKKKGDKSEKTE